MYTHIHAHTQAPKQKKKGKVVLHGTGKAQKKSDVFDLGDDYAYGAGEDDLDFM